MLHYGLLPHARRLWDWLFDNLELVVVDEVHEYRGVFGSHVGLVLRRLARLAAERYATESARELRERGEQDLADGLRTHRTARTGDTGADRGLSLL
jgi:ATP-dependent helicase YprA (DUF1998 family)